MCKLVWTFVVGLQQNQVFVCLWSTCRFLLFSWFKKMETHTKKKKYSNPYRENLIVKNTGLLCGSSSRCHGFVCSLRLWYFRIILTIFVLTKNIFSDSYKFLKYHVNSSSHCHDVNHFIPWLTEVFRKAVTIAISQKVTENDQETPQSHTKDTWVRDTEH